MRLRTTPRGRRGSILIVVIGLLALFAVVGLSFVLYADAEATAARSARAARNDDALPDPAIPAQDFLRQLIFDTSDNTSMMLGQSLMTSRFAPGSNVPYTGTGIPSEPVGVNAVNFDRRLLVNYALGATKATPPFNFSQGTSAPFSKAVPWTYPDTNNFYLAWMNPASGRVEVPSFHRPDVFGDLGPANPKWTQIESALLTLRPHPSLHPNFPRVPANPDGSHTGDVSNLKFMTGSQINDSLWMYAGSPVQTWRGRRYVAMVAPLVLDLSGRVNLSVAGNNRAGGAHAGTHGFGPWEINPLAVMGAANQADLTALIAARYNSTPVPGDRSSNGTTGLINRGHNATNVNDTRPAPFYSRIDADGVGSGTDGPPALPIATATSPFPDYPSRFENPGATAAALASHMSMFNPFQWGRGSASGTAHGFGMDDLVKLGSRYNDPKNRYTTAEIAQKAPTSMANADVRHLTTAFSVSQRWGRLPVNGGTAHVGPVDLNRPLPEYRNNPALPLASNNLVGAAQLAECNEEREHLAWDIFVRLLACAGMVDGTNIVYVPSTGHLTYGMGYSPTPQVKQLAQFAVNVVDYIDGDDVMTRFEWHTAADAVFGTELPKLVLNEAYSAMVNHNDDSAPPIFPMVPMNMKRPAQKPIQKKFWVELHNPLRADPTLPDNSAARLFDTNGNINCYELLIGEDGGANGTSYSTFLQNDPASAAQDPAGGGIAIKVRVNQFNNGTANPALGGAERYLVEPFDGAAAVANANKGYYVIGPPDRTTNPPAAPATTFPDKQDAALTLSFVPTGGQNSMQYDAVSGVPSQANITAERNKKHTVVLRRLANPYIAAAPGTNPFVTVDVVEGVPTHDRIEFDDQDRRGNGNGNGNNGNGNGNMGLDDEGSIGKRHPYASGLYTPAGGAGQPVLALQTAAGNVRPPHTFFLPNSNLDNVQNGLAWLVHLDRELVNATEVLQTSIHCPAMLTTRFFNGALAAGANYNQHVHSPNALHGNLLDPAFLANGYKAFDVLTVGSRLPGVPLGGREPGLVNVNTVNDPRIGSALLDPHAGNSFNLAWANTAWAGLTTSRTPAAIPALTDKPFQPGTCPMTTSMEQTLLRSNGTGTPTLFNIAPTNGSHEYFRAEPLRKVMNNVTTVTDGFLVVWTVGFFEVESVNGSGPVIGKELYERVPGDLRSQFAAVVDRSMVTVDANPSTKLGPKPWETKTTADAHPGTTTLVVQGTVNGNSLSVWLDGQQYSSLGQMWLGLGNAALGTGDGELVTASNAAPGPYPGQVTLTITPTNFYHGGGARLSNALLGAPAPAQVTAFNPADPANRHIVPYYIRLQP
jgi:hypothetical protein